NWDGIGHERIGAPDRIEVPQPGQAHKASKSEGGVCPRHQKRARVHAARDKVFGLPRRQRSWRGNPLELGFPGCALKVSGLVSWRSVVGERPSANSRGSVVGGAKVITWQLGIVVRA